MNSSTFRITNNGKFEAQIKFYLASNLSNEEEGDKYEEFKDYFKNIFLIDPPEMNLAID